MSLNLLSMLTLWLRLAGKTIIIEITIVKRNIFSDANEAGVGASLAPPSPVQAEFQEVTSKKDKESLTDEREPAVDVDPVAEASR